MGSFPRRFTRADFQRSSAYCPSARAGRARYLLLAWFAWSACANHRHPPCPDTCRMLLTGTRAPLRARSSARPNSADAGAGEQTSDSAVEWQSILQHEHGEDRVAYLPVGRVVARRVRITGERDRAGPRSIRRCSSGFPGTQLHVTVGERGICLRYFLNRRQFLHFTDLFPALLRHSLSRIWIRICYSRLSPQGTQKATRCENTESPHPYSIKQAVG